MDLRRTACCALTQLCHINDTTPLKKIKELIQEKRDQATDPSHDPCDYGKGETMLFAITTPWEKKLATKLKKVGFVETLKFDRRMCSIEHDMLHKEHYYGEKTLRGQLTMWTIKL